jgi:hypothetical protein
MPTPNAAPDYQQNSIERLLLRPGWTFKGLQPFAIAPWQTWSLALLAVIVTVLLVWVL